MSRSASSNHPTTGRLLNRRLVVVTGKGGVGKTALTAVLGRLLQRRGRRVLLMEVDPRESLFQMLEVPPSGGDIVHAGDGLFLQHVRPRAVLEDIVRDRLPFEMLTRRVLASPIFHHFVEGAPGLEEMAVLGHALRMFTGELGAPDLRPDVVVLDAPATGHGVSLLAAPLLVSDVIHHGPLGRLALRLAEFVADREQCAVVIVTQAEEMPVQEALELRKMLREQLHREPELLVVNGVYPRGADEPTNDERERALRELLRKRRELNERELLRIEREWGGTVVRLPSLPLERGPLLVDGLAQRLGPALWPGNE